MVKYLEFNDGKSNKFWEIEVKDNSHTIRFGKIGSNGSTKTKKFTTTEEAEKDAEKLKNSKLKKGYKEIGASDTKDKSGLIKTVAQGMVPPWIETNVNEQEKLGIENNETKKFIEELKSLPWHKYEEDCKSDLIESFHYLMKYHEEQLNESLIGFYAEFSNCYDRENPICCDEFSWGQGDDEKFRSGPERGGISGLWDITEVYFDAYDEFSSNAQEDRKNLQIIKEYMWRKIALTMGKAMKEAVESDEFKRLPMAEKYSFYINEHDGWACSLDKKGLFFICE